MTSFQVGQKTVDVFQSENPNRPVIYLNTYGREGEAVFRQIRAFGDLDFTLVAISGLNWEHDMVPWDIPPISSKDTPCTGGADAYLELLLNEILPQAEKTVFGTPLWRGIAGYSLAGLFALYSIYRTDVFSRAASVSGSLWFPDFPAFVRSHTPKQNPACIYFSLGDKEHKTRNPFLQTVRQNTEEMEDFYKQQGIATTFQLNPGNHFQDAALRTASGIRWILNR